MRPVRLAYNSYFFSERTVFSSYNKSAHGTFSHDLSAKRKKLYDKDHCRKRDIICSPRRGILARQYPRRPKSHLWPHSAPTRNAAASKAAPSSQVITVRVQPAIARPTLFSLAPPARQSGRGVATCCQIPPARLEGGRARGAGLGSPGHLCAGALAEDGDVMGVGLTSLHRSMPIDKHLQPEEEVEVGRRRHDSSARSGRCQEVRG